MDRTTMSDSMLTTLHIFDLKPHPDNPRKDLGDLEELTESIRKNGVMQNLTVVPEDEDNPKKYIVLIGHRRMAAARAAGVYQVPARIVFGLSHREQVGIMLEENMQRNDLTIVEQAQGFQMMLDLGETEESIAEKTGFSRTTVRHRLQLAKLDQKELKRRQEDEGFQLSLKDLYALEAVKDIDTRNKILKDAYSSNEIRRQAENVARNEKRQMTAAAIMKQMEPYGIKPMPKSEKNWRWNDKWDIIKRINLDDPEKEIDLELKDGEVPRGAISFGELCICVPKRKTRKESQADERQKDIERRREALSKLQHQFEEERRLFVGGVVEGKYNPPEDPERVERILWGMALDKYTSIDWSGFYEYITGGKAWKLSDEDKEKAVEHLKNKTSLDLILIAVVKSYKGFTLADWRGKYMPKEMMKLKALYNMPRLYGYQTSDEENKILAGTHELYIKEEDNA